MGLKAFQFATHQLPKFLVPLMLRCIGPTIAKVESREGRFFAQYPLTSISEDFEGNSNTGMWLRRILHRLTRISFWSCVVLG